MKRQAMKSSSSSGDVGALRRVVDRPVKKHKLVNDSGDGSKKSDEDVKDNLTIPALANQYSQKELDLSDEKRNSAIDRIYEELRVFIQKPRLTFDERRHFHDLQHRLVKILPFENVMRNTYKEREMIKKRYKNIEDMYKRVTEHLEKLLEDGNKSRPVQTQQDRDLLLLTAAAPAYLAEFVNTKQKLDELKKKKDDVFEESSLYYKLRALMNKFEKKLSSVDLMMRS